MKVQADKHHQAEKHDSKDVYKSEKSVFDRSSPNKTLIHAPAQTTGAFARILEENRKNDAKDNGRTAKSETADQDAETKRTEKDSKSERAREERAEEKQEQSGHGGGTGTEGDDGQSQSSAMIALQTHGSSNSDSAPPARSILHVADLERIVSTIRTDTFRQKKQVLIELKNSVLKGLQIKLSIGENGQVTAEFVTGDEKVRKQLQKRRAELAEILGNRSKSIARVDILG